VTPAAQPIALVGCGAWGANILRDLRELGRTVAVVATSPESIARARAGGAELVVASLDELPAVAGAVVATPATTHAEICPALLERGLPVFCEKPLSADIAEARALGDGWPDRLFVMDKWRYHGGVEALRDLVAAGDLGRPVGLICVREQWGTPDRDTDTIWTHVPHDLAIALEVLGRLGAVRDAVAEHIGGQVAGLHGSLGDEPWLIVSHSMAAPATRRSVRLVCEEGSATLADSYDDCLSVVRGLPRRGVAPERRPLDPEWPLRKELRAFLHHLDGGPPPRTSAGEHVLMLERLVELRRAAGLGD
jgi:predicted dehydrogenase